MIGKSKSELRRCLKFHLGPSMSRALLSILVLISALSCAEKKEDDAEEVATVAAASHSSTYAKLLANPTPLSSAELGAKGGELPDGTTPDESHPPLNLPIYNDLYPGEDACYVACYSHDKANSIYKLSSSEDIYVMGFYRIPGGL